MRHIDKRVYKRFPASISMRYFLWNPLFWKKEYTGTIKNISEKGMYISTKTPYFPRDSLLEIFIPAREDELYLPARMSTITWRSILSDNSCDGIGVELSNSPRDYLSLLENLKTAF